MKKTMKTLAALGLVCAMGTVSFAAEPETVTVPGSTSQEVKASYTAGQETVVNKYSAKITWATTTGTYEVAAATYTWDPETLSYKKSGGEATNTHATVNVTIENRSDKEIYATTAYADKADDQITTKQGSASKALNKEKIDSCINSGSGSSATIKEQAPKVESNFTVEVTEGKEKLEQDATTIGTVTVTLATTNQ